MRKPQPFNRLSYIHAIRDAHYRVKYTDDARVVAVDGWDARLVRINKVRERAKLVHATRVSAKTSFETMWQTLDKVREVLARDGVVLAIDTEYDERKRLTEVGLCIYKAGAFAARNLQPKKHQPAHDRFKHGTSEIVDRDTLKAEIVTAVAQADLIVGHSLTSDIKMLKANEIVINPRCVADTALLSSLYGQRGVWMKLGSLCRRLEITPSGLHCGGNDAFYTAQALVKMAQTLTRPKIPLA